MLNKHLLTLCVLISVIFGSGCRQNNERPQTVEVAVTNTYLQAVVNDLTANGVEVFCLMPPGMCPGHFDISPEQIRRLLNSKALFRFDFQAGLDDRLKRVGTPIVPVEALSGMCIPDSYLRTCRQMLPRLTESVAVSPDGCLANLTQLEMRLKQLTVHFKEQLDREGLTGVKVLASTHQAGFAEWLGLDVVAVFRGVDGMTPADIDACLQVGRAHDVAIVIANRQEGTELPGRIARLLNARLVVFSNFPETDVHSTGAFERLLQSNVDNLIHRDDTPK